MVACEPSTTFFKGWRNEFANCFAIDRKLKVEDSSSLGFESPRAHRLILIKKNIFLKSKNNYNKPFLLADFSTFLISSKENNARTSLIISLPTGT